MSPYVRVGELPLRTPPRVQVFAVYKKTIIMALLLVSLGPLTAQAGGESARNEALFTLDLSAAGGEIIYVGPDGNLFRESNDQDGLQPKEIPFEHGGETYYLDPDARLIV